MRRTPWVFFAIVLLGLWAWSQQRVDPAAGGTAPHAPAAPVRSATDGRGDPPPAWLPREAHDTLRRIAAGGPHPHRQDGSTFQNREGRLPVRPRGAYREYTVATPGARDRGARRIIAAGDPPVALFYTDDHYRSFRRLPDGVASP